MGRWTVLAALLLGVPGCDRAESRSWMQRYVAEVNAHHQTQQIKNAEVAARDMEIENQKLFIQILNDRIAAQEKDLDRLRSKLVQVRGTPPAVKATVTALAGEIGMVVLDAGSDTGLIEGDILSIVRDAKPIARVKVDRVEKKRCAAKVIDRVDDPRKGDGAVSPPIEK